MQLHELSEQVRVFVDDVISFLEDTTQPITYQLIRSIDLKARCLRLRDEIELWKFENKKNMIKGDGDPIEMKLLKETLDTIDKRHKSAHEILTSGVADMKRLKEIEDGK